MNIEEAIKLIERLSDGEDVTKEDEEILKAFLDEYFGKPQTSLDIPDDMSAECSMCGKPMNYRYCGMCPHCEMVWNG